MVKQVLITISLLTAVAASSAWADFSTPPSSAEDGQTVDATPAAPAVVETLRIVTYGDSITAGYGATPYSVYLQQMLDAKGCNAVVINQGQNGQTTNDGARLIGNVLAARQPHYILIMEGANDARIGIGAYATVSWLGSMMDQAQAAGAIPLISAITPDTESGSENRSIPDIYNPGIATEAANRKVTYVDNYTALAGANWGLYNYDGLHLNDAGQRVVAEQFFKALPCGGGGSGSGSGSSGGGGCFIATAAYGSLLEPHVVLLRDFRDRYLLTNGPGRSFVSTYYTYSPPVADYIAGHGALKMIVRILLLPLIACAYLLLHGLWYLIPLTIIAAVLCTLRLAGLRKRTQYV